MCPVTRRKRRCSVSGSVVAFESHGRHPSRRASGMCSPQPWMVRRLDMLHTACGIPARGRISFVTSDTAGMLLCPDAEQEAVSCRLALVRVLLV